MRRLFLSLFFLSGLVFCQTVIAETYVSGNQWGTWDLAGSPYILNGNVTVPSEEPFNDWGSDGIPLTFDEGEGDGQYTPGEPYTDWNGNGSYDDPLVLTISSGVVVPFPTSP